MKLTKFEREMLSGKHGKATQKAMEILVGLGKIYHADRMAPVSSVQISGVSFDNLGEAGLQFLEQMAENGGKARVLTTLNPSGMDIENWQSLGIDKRFAENQFRVIQAYQRMDIISTCTCTPYLSGNLPHFGEHIAWAESSAVCYANSILGARSNREGGPSALAASLTGRTPRYGYHLESARKPDITVVVEKIPATRQDGMATKEFGALGKSIGEKLEARGKRIPYITGLKEASMEELKSFCASIATYGGVALCHIDNITPEASNFTPAKEKIQISAKDIINAINSLGDISAKEVDFISLGCPHLSIKEIARLAGLIQGKKVEKEFWITTSRPTKKISDLMGYTEIIEYTGAKFATDTCCVVAPIGGRFRGLATDSAKACYYGYAKNNMRTLLCSFEDAIAIAVGDYPTNP